MEKIRDLLHSGSFHHCIVMVIYQPFVLSNPKKIYIVIGIAYIRQIPDLRLLFSNLLVDHFLIHT